MVSLIAFITLNKMIFAVAAKVFLNFLFFKFTYLDCNNSVSRLFLVSFQDALQVLNSLLDKFYCWDFRNETLITHYEEKIRDHHKLCLILRNWYLTLNISNINLFSVSKWVEQVSLIVLKVAGIKNELGEQINCFLKELLVTRSALYASIALFLVLYFARNRQLTYSEF